MLTTIPLRIGVLCSGRAPGLMHLLTRAQGRGIGWEIVCCITSEEAFEGEAEVLAQRVPIVRHPARCFYATHAPGTPLFDLDVREQYDRATVEILREYQVDLVLLAGYLLILTDPVLRAFPRRIINVHHSDLMQRDASGAVRYPGLRAVRDAILAGEPETRCSAHLVTADLDEGPLLCRSTPFPVPDVARWALAHGQHDLVRRVIWAHQEWMLRSAFGPLMAQAIGQTALVECAR
jgi:phosphoribosylglycinamide formyltransferase-1